MPGDLPLHPLSHSGSYGAIQGLQSFIPVRAAASMLVWRGEGLQPSAGAWHASAGPLAQGALGMRASLARRAYLLLMVPVVQPCHALHGAAGQMLGCCTLNVTESPGQSSSSCADLAG